MRTHGHREGSTTYWGLLGGIGEGQWGGGSWGGIAWGEMPNVYRAQNLDDRLMVQQTTMAHVYLCNKPALSAHVCQNLKVKQKK